MKNLFAYNPRYLRVAVLLLALTTLFPFHGKAQGVTGTTVTLDGTNCTVLYSQGASSSSQAYFSYLRHNVVPIQITNANYYGLTDTGTGLFLNMVNNMGITDGNIVLYNYAGNSAVLYFAIIAPQGYNIARYVLDVNSSVVRNTAAGNAAGAVIEEYTYTQNNSDGDPVFTDNRLSLTGARSEVLDVTKSGGVNKLYFKITFNDTQAYQVNFNSLKLTFSIDEPFTVSIPNAEGSTDVHTGLIDLGEFSSNSRGVWTFTDSNVNDLQQVGFFGEDSEGADIAVGSTTIDDDNYVWTLKNGTFYLEAPKIYRVTGASLEFLSHEVAIEENTQYNAVTSIASGHQYILGNGSAYLQVYTNTYGAYAVRTVTSQTDATVWTVTSDGDGQYYIYSERYERYLYADSSLKLSTTTAAGSYGSTAAWTYNTSTGYLSMAYKGRTSTSTYYLRYSSSAIGVTNATTGTNGNSRIQHPFTEYIHTPASTSQASTYTATVYAADGETVAATDTLSPANNRVTLNVDGLNNDAVKFSISGLEGSEVGLFHVSISVQMLDPHVNVIKTAYQESGGPVVSEVSSASENMAFNAGETIVVPIPGEIAKEKGADYQYPIVFRDAYNENRSADYDGTASGNGLSQYYLVKSPYYNTGAGSKVDADMAGTNELEFTNIKQVKAGTASRIQDNDFSEAQAAFETIRLKNEQSKTVYIYCADEPKYLVLPEARRTVRHIAYAYYKATVMPYVVEEVPDIEMADVSDIVIYQQTLKGQNNKKPDIARDTQTDTQHYFFGIKVKAKKEDPNNHSAVKGVLTSEQIITAVKNLLVTEFLAHIYSVDDPFRTILYLDMSELTTVSDADGLWADFFNKTADNCLCFMPAGSSYNAANVVAGGENGEATGDIVVYDQQPFYNPYTFKTGTHQVTYERNGTNEKDPTQNTTLILPFDIPLSAEGCLKTYSNVVNDGVKFYKMQSVGEEDTGADVSTKAYLFNAEAVSGGVAAANAPYHIVSTVKDDRKSYLIQLTGATFRPTNTTDRVQETTGNLTAYGNCRGLEVDKSEDILYFSQEYFWRSSTLTASNTVKVLPFRVYYKTTAQLGGAKQLSIRFAEAGETTSPVGISNVNAGRLRMVPVEGGIEVAASADTRIRIYDVSGRMAAAGRVQGGEVRRFALAKGIYIANGVKLAVK